MEDHVGADIDFPFLGRDIAPLGGQGRGQFGPVAVAAFPIGATDQLVENRIIDPLADIGNVEAGAETGGQGLHADGKGWTIVLGGGGCRHRQNRGRYHDHPFEDCHIALRS